MWKNSFGLISPRAVCPGAGGLRAGVQVVMLEWLGELACTSQYHTSTGISGLVSEPGGQRARCVPQSCVPLSWWPQSRWYRSWWSLGLRTHSEISRPGLDSSPSSQASVSHPARPSSRAGPLQPQKHALQGLLKSSCSKRPPARNIRP
jgi:hypothetical protein